MDISLLFLWVPLLAVLGLVAGFLAGLLGVGGGMILVPGLFFSLEALGFSSAYTMHIAVGTSLAIIVPTGLSSARAHAKRGAVRPDLVRLIGPGIIAGVAAGTLIAARISGDDLRLVFAVSLLVLAALMTLDPQRFRLADSLPPRPWPALAGGVIGLLSTLMGIGGATVSVPYMTLYRVPIHQAVGTASALGLIISIPAAFGFILIGWGKDSLPPFSFGYINLLAAAMIVPFSVLAAPWGAHTAHRVSVVALRRAFAVFLMIVSLRMLYDVAYG